jgi:hypothetical protein
VGFILADLKPVPTHVSRFCVTPDYRKEEGIC